MTKHFVLSLAAALGLAATSSAATIVWGAGQDNGFSLFSGAELPQQSLVRLGYFNLTDAQIQAIGTNVGLLNSSFTEIATARIGDGIGAPSNFSKSSTADTSAVVGLQMYLWAFASTDNSSVTNSINSATQIGVFYFDKNSGGTTAAKWAFPVQTPVPGSTSIDLSDLTGAAANAPLVGPAAHIVIGDFPKGTSTAGSAPNFGLRQVPEPTTVGLIGFGVLGLIARRRRTA